MFWMVGEMCVPFFPLSKWDVNFIKLKGKNQILNTVLASTRWSCCWAPSGIYKLTIVPSKVENIGRNPITIESMIINTLRVRIRAWLDAQNPASVLMWAPPAAIAKWGLQTPLQTERTFCHFYCFGFIFTVLVLFCSCRQDLQREYESRRDLRISDRLPQGVWQHYARASSEWENEFNLKFLAGLIQRTDTGCWSCTTRMRSCRKQLRLLAQRGQESNFPAYTVNQ